TGMIVGTPFYMSPEQMTRASDVDARSDIWSLGCVLYELLTGAPPFRAQALTELVGKVLQDEPLPPSAQGVAIPPALDAIVMRCLAKPRDLRFQSVTELLAALRGTTAPAPLTAELPAARPIAVSSAELAAPLVSSH